MTNNRKQTCVIRVMVAALMLCVGAMLFTQPVYAKTNDKDKTPPKVTATLKEEVLTVTATDDGSGVEAVVVDGRRITTLVNGSATVKAKEYHGGNKEISVYATDYAGNKSEVVKFTNPYYKAPAPLSKPSEPKPAASSSKSQPPTAPVRPQNAAQNVSSSSVSVNPSSSQNTSGESEPENAPSDITYPEGALPFTPEGAGTVQDNATDEDGKEFYTINTADGTVYYLVIDRQRGEENVYFLGEVTQQDLLSLAASESPFGESEELPVPQEGAEKQDPNGEETELTEESAQEPEKSDNNTLVFVLIAALAVGGAGWYFKIHKPKKQAQFEEDDELEDWEDDDYEFEEELDKDEEETSSKNDDDGDEEC